MKRTIFLRYLHIFSCLAYFAFIGYFLLIGKTIETWFSLACIVVGLNILVKSCFFKLDSSLYISSILIHIGIASYVQYILKISGALFYPAYIFSLAFASFMVFSIFRQKIHLKLFVISGVEVLILFLYKFGVLPKLVFYVINALYLILILLFFIKVVRKNTQVQK